MWGIVMLAICLALIDEPSDKEKFLAIYDTYKNMMYNKAMSVLHVSSLAEDAVQESLIKIAKNISKISSVDCSQTRSFIVIIVRNTSLNMIKSEHIKLTEEIDESTPDVSMDVLSKVMSKQGYEYLITLVNDLDDIYTDVLTLKLVMGYSNEEISSLLGVPRKTVDSRIYRGKKILQHKLEDYYGEK